MQNDEPEIMEYDQWRWHIQGRFPKDQLPEHGYVHIGMYLTWLIGRDLLDPEWVQKAGVRRAVAAVKEREQTGCALRDMTNGSLASDMLSEDGRAFTSAYYAPEYGYPSDYRRVFGRRADGYAVPDGWESYDRLAPLLDRRYGEWVSAGRPEYVPMPRLLGSLYRLLRPKGR
jgi:hypothetical protein